MNLYLIVLVIAILSVGHARHILFSNTNTPIRMIQTSEGQNIHERVTYLEADIHPRHVRNNSRINFPTSGAFNDYFEQAKAVGDERGYLVGSQFSGPAEWYNLSPQNARVNRNMEYTSITTDWYGAECEVRQFLDQGGNRFVRWIVKMAYVRDSNRPDQYHLKVEYWVDGRRTVGGIDITIRNPFLSEDSTFWICKTCRNNSQESISGCTQA